MGTVTITIEVPGRTEVQAAAIKAKIAALAELPPGTVVRVGYSSEV